MAVIFNIILSVNEFWNKIQIFKSDSAFLCVFWAITMG